MINELKQQLLIDEGISLTAYKDSVGVWTIGVGRNLQTMKISHKQAIDWLDEDIDETITMLNQYLTWWHELSDIRRQVLANMCFNMGIFKLMGFNKMLKALKAHDYETAAAEMKDSKWYRQVGKRADRLVYMMLNNEAK